MTFPLGICRLGRSSICAGHNRNRCNICCATSRLSSNKCNPVSTPEYRIEFIIFIRCYGCVRNNGSVIVILTSSLCPTSKCEVRLRSTNCLLDVIRTCLALGNLILVENIRTLGIFVECYIDNISEIRTNDNFFGFSDSNRRVKRSLRAVFRSRPNKPSAEHFSIRDSRDAYLLQDLSIFNDLCAYQISRGIVEFEI